MLAKTSFDIREMSTRLLPRDAAMNRTATSEEQKTILEAVRKGLDEGALGMGMGIAYTLTGTPDEILDLFYIAARFKRPETHNHVCELCSIFHAVY